MDGDAVNGQGPWILFVRTYTIELSIDGGSVKMRKVRTPGKIYSRKSFTVDLISYPSVLPG